MTSGIAASTVPALDALNALEKLWQADSCFSGKILTSKEEVQGILRATQGFMKTSKITLAVGAIFAVISAISVISTGCLFPLILPLAVVGSAALLAIAYDFFILSKASSSVERVCGEFSDTIQSAPSDSVRFTHMEQRFRWSREFADIRDQIRNTFFCSDILGKSTLS